ncbi:MAG: phosphonate transport system ATP-binding protein [Clostridiales bacterium]|jgi:phosphonate transport system ATP-binding protein|nr:phosphonate transport system ATP-binding protein [Clostridiales bacterium]
MICLEKVRKNFGENQVLKEIDFELKKGEFTVILGSSGAGKSTLLRCINGLCVPTDGKITINGMEVNKRNINKIRKRVGFIFQDINVVGNLNVMQNVLIGRLGYKSPWNIFFSKEEKDKAEQAIEMVGLIDKIHTRVDKLSGGQRQRVGIARVLVQNPDIILADEPVASLDPVTGQGIMELIRKINQEMGTIILCNLHQLEYAKKYGQRIIGISEGKIQFDKNSSDINDNDLRTIYGDSFDKSSVKFKDSIEIKKNRIVCSI